MPAKRHLKFAALALCLAALTALPGCFDYDIDLTLQEDGQGDLSLSLSLPAGLEGQAAPASLGRIASPPPRRGQSQGDGRVVITEQAEFKALNMMTLKGMDVKVEQIKGSILGMTDATYRLTVHFDPVEGGGPGSRRVLPLAEVEQAPVAAPGQVPALERAQGYVGRALDGYFASLRVKAPGEIKRAGAVGVGDQMIQPMVDQAKGLVTWRIPLSLLVNVNQRAPLGFSLDFVGEFKFPKGGKVEVSTRAPMAAPAAAAGEQAQPGAAAQ